MPNFLFLFLDGVGLGDDNLTTNPLAIASMPNLEWLPEGRRLLRASVDEGAWHGGQASLLALDANLGVEGLPQSATGQATLLTGRNIPAILGEHYGPKPNPPIAGLLQQGTLFHDFSANGNDTPGAALLNAYPPAYFASIQSGRRLYAAIPQAVASAGVPLMTQADLNAGRALSADFTGQGWRLHLGLENTPLLTPRQAGERLARLAQGYRFAFFEYWLSDYAGHHQDMPAAIEILATLDEVLGGLAAAWQNVPGLILVTSDHGNMENLSTRRHTRNPVPALLIGPPEMRQAFAHNLRALTDVAPAIRRLLKNHPS